MIEGDSALKTEGNKIFLSGRMDADGVGRIWLKAAETISSGAGPVVIDCSSVNYMDGSGAALLLMLRNRAAEQKRSVDIENLKSEYASFLEILKPDENGLQGSGVKKKKGLAGWISALGVSAHEFGCDLYDQIEFIGSCMLALKEVIFSRRGFRWKDFWLGCEKVGADGLPIILLIGFLMGLIMSFQSAITLKNFGGEIFVPNMLGLVMFRELGPMVTAILIAGRTGSAFAAEIGTMKVNEELDALSTMGLNPVRFLVLPRVLSAVSMAPLLTLFFNFMSLVGGAIVMLSMDYPLSTYCGRVFANVGWTDFIGGMVKGVVFSFLVAGIGCQRGLVTRSGASAVGDSTTSAVVSGIILIAVSDGLFAVLFYLAGI
jgi:phospholipid/cholesterol/gamma-HCH transport system permease protein